jgi:hypothetical protein
MKKIMIAILCSVLAIGSVSAHGWGGGYHGGYHGGYYHRGGGGHFIGGLLVGSLIGAVAVDHYSQPGVVYQSEYQQPYTVQQAPVYCIDGYGRQYICQYQTVRVYEPQD